MQDLIDKLYSTADTGNLVVVKIILVEVNLGTDTKVSITIFFGTTVSGILKDYVEVTVETEPDTDNY